MFEWKKGHDTFSSRLKDIVYFESDGRKVLIRFSDGSSDEFYGSLRDVYHSQLKERDFLFIHASYLVNYDHVAAVKNDHLLIRGGEKPLPISRERKSEVMAAWLAITRRRRGM
ncbi:MAG: LytTR family transcriptional regulator [Treponema sp.]|nr:LytTR family transcriptional regulator [Treponema sp.]